MNLCLDYNQSTNQSHFDGRIVNDSLNIHKKEVSQNEIFLNYVSSPEIINGSPYKHVSRLSNHSNAEVATQRHFTTNVSLSDAHFMSGDSSNSNCRESFFIPSSDNRLVLERPRYSYNNAVDVFDGEKKYISELHIDIKEPFPNEGDNKCTFKETEVYDTPDYPIVHSSHYQAYIGENQFAYTQRNSSLSDNRSTSSESLKTKKLCHHSEKFIYLNADPQVDSNLDRQNYELHTYHSPVDLQQQLSLKSEQSMADDETKSFSSKSIQTSQKIDCIFKSTTDKCIETDFIGVSFKLDREDKKEIINKGFVERHDLSPSSSSSPDVSIGYRESSDDKHHKFKMYNEQANYVANSKQMKNYGRVFNRTRNKGPHDDSNQDTDIASYSESFNKSNDDHQKENDDLLHGKFFANKPSIRKPEKIKSNKTNVNPKPNVRAKNCKRYSEKKDTVKNGPNNDLKSSVNSKVESERHSYEIQCLLDNLNIHLQNTVNSHKATLGPPKLNAAQFNNTSSFWDNPLNPETSRSLYLNKQVVPKERNRLKTVNPEIQALFETLDKSHHQPDKNDSIIVRPKQSPKTDVNTRVHKMANTSINDNHSVKKCCEGFGSVDNLNDVRFPTNLKFQKTFELSPYDELVRSHANSADRRIKSVASKNGCQIVIDGPISLTDPTSTCQAIRNKIAYSCTVAGSSKDRLDKCLNYLKETFPNTCLRLHNRNNLSSKS